MKKVLIVGAFKRPSNGSTGGVLFASLSIVESGLSKNIEWIKIDSTAKVPIKSYSRITKAVKRFFIYTYNIFFSVNMPTVYIFVSDGFSFLEKGLMALIAKSANKKVILAPVSGYIEDQLSNKLFKRYVAYVLSKVDIVVCQGTKWKTLFENLVEEQNENKFIIIPNWINADNYKLKNYNNIDKHQGVKILFLSWVTFKKGIFDLIDAIQLVVKDLSNIQVVIAGHGSSYTEAESRITELGLAQYFTFEGWVDHAKKVELFEASDIFVLPSHAEGFPNVVLEAMASGLPVIASNVGAIQDVIDDETGVIVEPRNISQLAENIVRLGKDKNLRQMLGENAFRKINRYYTVDHAIGRISKIL